MVAYLVMISLILGGLAGMGAVMEKVLDNIITEDEE